MDHVHPDCVTMTVPSGYQLPVRGFGKIWCEEELWNPVGWPAETEVAVNLLVQPMQSGVLMRVPLSSMTYLIALDYRAVRGLTLMTAP
jgi:hypothetical protein